MLEFALDHGAFPAPLNYRGFPKSICTSINHVVCHGIPGPKPLREGDIVNIDVTLIVDGWHGDTSRMYAVGHISRRAERLIDVTYEALKRGIAAVRPGATTGHIGAAIQAYAEAERCSVVRDFCGHGLGRVFHDRPNILHYGEPGEGVTLEPGMLFTIEPMINLGRPHVKVLPDGWTAVTRDRELSAQFEHTVGVTETGCEVFTYSPQGSTVRRSSSTEAQWDARHAGPQERRRRRWGGRPAFVPRGAAARSRRATGSGCASASARAASDALPDYELLELVLFRALPRRDTKGLAKRLIARFGSFAEVVNAPEPRLKEVKGVGEAVVTELKLIRAAALAPDARRDHGEAGAVVVEAGARLSARRPELRAPRAVPRAVSRQEEPASSPTRCSRRGPSITRRSTCARW